MVWDKVFGKKKKEEIDPLKDLILSKLKVGYLLDYDLKIWEVTGYNKYEWGESDYSEEWELLSGDEVFYLEREEDDEVEWTLTRKVPLSAIGEGIKDSIIEHEDPPKEITYDGKKYYLGECSGGRFYKDGKDAYDEFLSWDYEDESGENVLSIEQWSETRFEASHGKVVEEYQFTNILPK